MHRGDLEDSERLQRTHEAARRTFGGHPFDGQSHMRFDEVLSEIDRALPKVTWRLGEIEEDEIKRAVMREVSFRSFGGEADGWRFIVCTWHEKGDPPGDRTFDGTAAKGGVILHLTLELAMKAVTLAEIQLKGNDE
jgi:hypothetical protein